MDQNQTYTLRRSERKPLNGAKIFVIVAAIAAFSAALFAGIHTGRQKALREAEASASVPSADAATEASSSETPATQPANEVYPVGLYQVNTGNYTLLLRKDHTADAEEILELETGDEVTVEEVLYDAASQDPNYLYWGRATVDGETGWLPMFYLKRSSEPGTADAEQTGGENTTADEAEAPNEAAVEPGPYTVDAGDDTVRLRKDAQSDAEVVAILADGAPVTVVGGKTDADGAVWVQVTADGSTGYLPASLLKEAQ